MTTRIAALHDRLGDSHVFEIAETFSEDLPLQIRCDVCGQHLLPQPVHGVMFYRHQNLWPRECVAPRDFRVTATYLLHEVLTRLIASRDCSRGTVGELLLKAVLFVTVEPTKASQIHVHLHEPTARAA